MFSVCLRIVSLVSSFSSFLPCPILQLQENFYNSNHLSGMSSFLNSIFSLNLCLPSAWATCLLFSPISCVPRCEVSHDALLCSDHIFFLLPEFFSVFLSKRIHDPPSVNCFGSNDKQILNEFSQFIVGMQMDTVN